MARPERFELPTFWFVARRSIQLSYGRAGAKNSSTASNRRQQAEYSGAFRCGSFLRRLSMRGRALQGRSKLCLIQESCARGR